jgi:hypothetical protein
MRNEEKICYATYKKSKPLYMTSNSFDVKHLAVGGNLILKGIAVIKPKTANKVKIGTIAPGVIVAPQGPLDEVTLVFPKKVVDGQVMFLSFTQDIKNVLFTNANFANGSLIGPSVKAGDSIALIYNAETNKWYKFSGGSTPPAK